MGISAITYSVLSYGVSYSHKPDHNRIALHEYLAPLEILDCQTEAVPVYEVLQAELRKSGKMFGLLDMLIAAQALFIFEVILQKGEERLKGIIVYRVV